jgi:hypothetical protein
MMEFLLKKRWKLTAEFMEQFEEGERLEKEIKQNLTILVLK